MQRVEQVDAGRSQEIPVAVEPAPLCAPVLEDLFAEMLFL